jgi:hypothetical protein
MENRLEKIQINLSNWRLMIPTTFNFHTLSAYKYAAYYTRLVQWIFGGVNLRIVSDLQLEVEKF